MPAAQDVFPRLDEFVTGLADDTFILSGMAWNEEQVLRGRSAIKGLMSIHQE
jgi:hypothetical protein